RIDVRTKGIDVLLEAWRRLRAHERWRDAWLLMVGSGRDSAWLHQQGIATDEHHVRWVDEYILDRSRMRALMSAADLYAFPSRHEGFPVALVEAMACGRPVVAAEAQGVRDIVGGDGRCGVVVPRDDASALAEALDASLGNETMRHSQGQAARARVLSDFSLEVVGRQLRHFVFGQPGA
ncbi:MAG: glycosyltransferase family 4 protein, partial [Gemmatimonadaceae bacterium]